MALLSAADKSRVEATIHAIEARTSGEVVVAVVPRSAAYERRRGLAALLWGLASALAVHVLTPAVGATWHIALVLPATLLWYLAFGAAPLLALLVPASLGRAKVLERALELFAEHGVYDTRERTGVLILVSELERQVIVLGDRAIDAVLGGDGWKHEIDVITTAVKQGRAAEGLVAALEELGKTLAERFPRRPDDKDELANTVIEER